MPYERLQSVLLGQIEGTEGVYQTLTGADALLVHDLEGDGLKAEAIQRKHIQPYFGGRKRVLTKKHSGVNFGVEAAGSGTAGTAPKYGRLIRPCGFAEVLTSGLATIAASPAVPTGTPTGVWTYTKTTKFSGIHERTVTIACTTGGASGVAAVTVSAPAIGSYAAYSQAGVVLTNGAALTLPNGAQITPTITTNFVNGDTWTIQLVPEQAAYKPITSGVPSSSFDYHYANERHRMVGARGNLDFMLGMNGFAEFKFQYLGLRVAAVQAATPGSLDFSAFKDPDEANHVTVALARIHGFDVRLKSIEVKTGGDVSLRQLSGSQYIRRSGRDVVASVQIENPDIAVKDYWALAEATTTGALQVHLGTVSGNCVEVYGAKCQLGQPKIVYDDDIEMLHADIYMIPTLGNDEVEYRIK